MMRLGAVSGFLLFGAMLATVGAANILCIMTVPSPSHHIWNRVVMEELVARGHNLTVVSQDTDDSRANLTYILLEKVYAAIYQDDAVDLLETAKEWKLSYVITFMGFFEGMCRGALQSEGLNVILNYPDDFKFDLVLYDFGCGPCLLPLLHKFNYPPLVSITPFLNPPYSVDVVGGHKHYAYTPHFLLSHNSDMTFFQRVFNTLLYLTEAGFREYQMLPATDRMVREKFPYKDLPYIQELEQRTVIMLLNTNPTYDTLEPLPPNVIAVGGAHIKEPPPLPTDLENFMTSAKKGAVLFSLGSNVRSDTIGEARQRMFIEVFRQLPDYHFLWKFESELKLELPRNVIIKPWLPQRSILAHSRTMAFITHSGGLSTQEASWFGVPLVAVPIFADQHRNCKLSVVGGVAEPLDFESLSVEKIKTALLKVLQNPRYRENMQQRSMYFRDQPDKPLDRAVWWIEYVLRHPDIKHLRSPTLALGTLRSNLVDVYAFLLAAVALALWVPYRVVRRLCSGRNRADKRKRE